MSRFIAATFAIVALVTPQFFVLPAAHPQDVETVATAAIPKVAVILAELSNGVASGTGFMVADRAVLTAAHVVSNARHILVKFPNYPAITPDAVKVDQDSDSAALRIPELPICPLNRHFDMGSVRAGQTVVVIGYPLIDTLGTQTPTVTTGIVSAVRSRLLQIQAPVNPGNSGGPVLDLQGHVIGVVRGTLGGQQQVNFATRIDVAGSAVDALERVFYPSLPSGYWLWPLGCP